MGLAQQQLLVFSIIAFPSGEKKISARHDRRVQKLKLKEKMIQGKQHKVDLNMMNNQNPGKKISLRVNELGKGIGLVIDHFLDND